MGLNLVDCVVIPAHQFPEREALVLGETRLTFRQFLEHVQRISGYLRSIGVAPGDRVALLLPNTPHFPMVYFGILHAGGVAVPLNPLHTASELTYLFGDFGPKCIVVWGESAAATRAARDTSAPGARLVYAGLSEAVSDGDTTFDAILRDSEPALSPALTQPDDLAVIAYTGAYGGRLMGAQLTHFNVFQNAQVVGTRLLHYTEQDRCLAVLPLFHGFGQCVMMSAALLAGACIVLMPRFDATKLLETVASERITVVGMVPTMYYFLLAAKTDPLPDLTTLRLVLAGGATMPFEYFAAFKERFGHTILEGYGLTETSPVVSFNMSEATNRPGSVGVPLWGCEVRAVNADGDPLPPGETGELILRGHNVMRGYLNQPEATASTIRDGWLHTGDWGYLDEDGYVFLRGLKKDMLIRAGLNVYPREVERVLEEHPDVLEAAVIGVLDHVRGEEPKAFVVPRTPGESLEKTLKDWCREHLAGYKCPRYYTFITGLPRTAEGAIDKDALRATE